MLLDENKRKIMTIPKGVTDEKGDAGSSAVVQLGFPTSHTTGGVSSSVPTLQPASRGLVASLHAKGEDFFGEVGVYVVRHPCRVYALTFLLFLAFAPGLMLVPSLTVVRAEDLWVDQDSKAKTIQNWVESSFRGFPRPTRVIITKDNSNYLNENVLTEQGLNKLWTVHNAVVNVRTPSSKDLHDICMRRVDYNGLCNVVGAVNFWNQSYPAFQSSTSKLADTEVEFYANSLEKVDHGEMLFSFANSNSSRGVGNGGMPWANGMQLIYLLKDTDTMPEDDILAWEKAFLESMEALDDAEKAQNTGFRIYRQATRSVDDELGRSVQGDIVLNIMCYTLMCLYCWLMLSRKPNPKLWENTGTKSRSRLYWWRVARIGSRYALSALGVLTVIVSTVIGYGFCLYCGVHFVSLHQVLPFILVGIGVDDMFIICSAFDAFAHLQHNPEERAKHALRKCGMTVTLTSLTNVVVFLFGLTFSYPAIQYFCVYAAVAIFVDYVLQLTVFVSFVVKDLQRQEDRLQEGCCLPFCPTRVAKKAGCWSPCVDGETGGALLTDAEVEECRKIILADKSHAHVEQVQEEHRHPDQVVASSSSPSDEKKNTNTGVAPDEVQKDKDFLFCPYEQANYRAWIKGTYGPFITHSLLVKLAIIAVFFGYCGFSAYCLTNVTKDFDLKDLAPDESYFRDMLTATEDLYTHSGKGRLTFSLYYKHTNHHATSAQAVMQEHETSTRLLAYVEDDYLASWFADFRVQQCGSGMAPVPDVSSSSPPSRALFVSTGQYRAENYAPCAALQAVSATPEAFGNAVYAWLQNPINSRWKDNIVFRDVADPITGSSNKVILYSRVTFKHTVEVVKPGKDAVEANKEIFAFAEAQESRINVVASSPFYQFFDQTWHIQEELMSNYALAVVGVLIVTVFVVPNAIAVVMLAFIICMVDIDLTGLIWLVGLDLNSISVINLIMAVGLVVDYSAHIVHAFFYETNLEDDKDTRIRHALTDMMPNVLKGGTTTFLGVLVFVFANSFIFRVFFKMFCGIVAFGLLHGLCLVPVLLSLLPDPRGPSGCKFGVAQAPSTGAPS
ncbi:unnamed protein product [Amoebophrya sp. A25]|nr:unnamed protein product [Amoebophrya sp. A25]|eukprot:GSA25T00021836001.1